MSGVKHDNGKPDLSLLPKSAKEGIARAFMDGEKKYSRYNYLQGMDWTRLLAAADRHLSAFNDGEDVAEDSQLNHLYHAGACICMLIEYYTKGLGIDNRFKANSQTIKKLQSDAPQLELGFDNEMGAGVITYKSYKPKEQS